MIQTQHRKCCYSGSAHDLRSLQYAMELTQRLLLRHEDAINLLRAESSLVMRRSTLGCSHVVRCGQFLAHHQAERAHQAGQANAAALLYCLFMEFKTRLEEVANKAEDLEKMEKLGWVSRSLAPQLWHGPIFGGT